MKLVIALVLLLAFAAIVAWAITRGPTTQQTSCTPEGGLACTDHAIQLCQDGKTVTRGQCPGGCEDHDGVARCRSQEGLLVAPAGAICRAGMALCGLDSASLLVCKDGRLAKAGDCPAGCRDQGKDAGLFCTDTAHSLRFAAGAACPAFSNATPFACDIDGQALLKCEDGLLIRHTVNCARCIQIDNGTLVCEGPDGTRLDPASGELQTL